MDHKIHDDSTLEHTAAEKSTCVDIHESMILHSKG